MSHTTCSYTSFVTTRARAITAPLCSFPKSRTEHHSHVTETKNFDLKTFESYLTRFTTQLTLPEVPRPSRSCNCHKIKMLVLHHILQFVICVK